MVGACTHPIDRLACLGLVLVAACSTTEATRDEDAPPTPPIPITAARHAAARHDAGGLSTPRAYDAGACPSPPVVDPTSVDSFTLLGANPPNCVNTMASSIGSFVLTAPRWIIVGAGHTSIPWPTSNVNVLHGCQPSGMVITTGGRCATGVALLQPGTYSVERCDKSLGNAQLVPPPPPLPNGSCATAVTLPSAEPHRVFEVGEPAYYTFKATAGVRWAIHVVPAAGAIGGRYTVRVRSQCADPTTTLLEQQGFVCTSNPTIDFPLGALPAATYSVAITHDDPGDALTISAVTY